MFSRAVCSSLSGSNVTNRETRDIDFLGFGPPDEAAITAVFAEIMTIETGDGLVFDIDALAASPIREEMEYEGIRLKTSAYLERSRIPVTLDVGFGDALVDATQTIDYPSLLDMEQPKIRSYPPETVIAEKFQALVALGLANGRMKDFYDLWAVPKSLAIEQDALLMPRSQQHSSGAKLRYRRNARWGFQSPWQKTPQPGSVGRPI